MRSPNGGNPQVGKVQAPDMTAPLMMLIVFLLAALTAVFFGYRQSWLGGRTVEVAHETKTPAIPAGHRK